jgi:hypothetical protein
MGNKNNLLANNNIMIIFLDVIYFNDEFKNKITFLTSWQLNA